METYLSQQAIAFLWSVVLGALLGVVYDFFRVGRILWRRGAVWVFLEDLLFSFMGAALTAFCLTLTNYGQVRLFLLIGEFLGFLLYFFTLGVFVATIARTLSCIFRWFWKRFLELMMKIMKISKKPFIFFSGWFRILITKLGRRKSPHGKGEESEETESRN